MEKLFNEQVLAVIAAIGGVAVLTVKSIWKIIKVKLDGWEQIIQKKTEIKLKNLEIVHLDLNRHPFWTVLTAYLLAIEQRKDAPNEFKRLVVIEYIKAYWRSYEEVFKEQLISTDVTNMNKEELLQDMVLMTSKCRLLRLEKLKSKQVPDKVINCFENVNIELTQQCIILYQSVISSKVYNANTERLWAILDVHEFILQSTTERDWIAIVNSNGDLEGLKYNGYVNTGTATKH